MNPEKEAEIYGYFIAILSSKKYPNHRQKWGDKLLIKMLKSNCLTPEMETNLLRLYSSLISDKYDSVGKGEDFSSLPSKKKKKIKMVMQALL